MINEEFLKRKLHRDGRTQDVTKRSYLRRITAKHGTSTKTLLKFAYEVEELKAISIGKYEIQ